MARRYTRDNRGRFASVGATARGGRLKTASGGRRAMVTRKISAKPDNTISRPKGYKAQSPSQLKTGIYLNRARSVNARTASRPDIAEQHIPGRFRGQAGKRLDASIDRAVAQVKAAERARLMKPKEQVRTEAVARKAAKDAAAAAKPKRTRTPLSMRTSRAKRILKEREIKISGTYRQWENSRRTQERALAYYAQQGRRR